MQFRRIGFSFCLLLVLASVPVRAQPPMPAPSEEAMREYEAKLADYTKAMQDFEEQSSKYWALVAEKRRLRNGKHSRQEEVVLTDYILDQPPVYSGPPKPIDPSAPLPPRNHHRRRGSSPLSRISSRPPRRTSASCRSSRRLRSNSRRHTREPLPQLD